MRGRCQKGFTLVEMVMTIAVFSIVIMMVGTSFSTLLKYSSAAMKSEESNIEGNIGLELMRHDVASLGFGLPSSFDASVTPTMLTQNYKEAAAGTASTLNDAPSNVPRAIAGKVALAATSITGGGSPSSSYQTIAASDYLAVKATSLGTDPVAQKWSYATYNPATNSATYKVWPSQANFANGDRAIVLNRSATSSNGSYSLIADPAASYWGVFAGGTLPAAFNPKTTQDMSFIYGIAGSGNLRMPFNRADFFVAAPQAAGALPAYCAPNTGILYRGMVRHSDGALDVQPLVDCVATMHVVLGWNMLDGTGTVASDPKTLSGKVDTWTKLDGTGISVTTTSALPPTIDQMQAALNSPSSISNQLKVVKVYVLAQAGNKDPGYTSPASFQLSNPLEEGGTPGVNFALPDPGMLNYRWKIYKLVLRPKNLTSNR